jgi:hypothetical protein
MPARSFDPRTATDAEIKLELERMAAWGRDGLVYKAHEEKMQLRAVLREAVRLSFSSRRLEERAKRAAQRDPREDLLDNEVEDIANQLRRSLETLMASSADDWKCFELEHPRITADRPRAE